MRWASKEKTPDVPGESVNRQDYARRTFGSRSDVGAGVDSKIQDSSKKDNLEGKPTRLHQGEVWQNKTEPIAPRRQPKGIPPGAEQISQDA